jgi:hypothetical protein
MENILDEVADVHCVVVLLESHLLGDPIGEVDGRSNGVVDGMESDLNSVGRTRMDELISALAQGGAERKDQQAWEHLRTGLGERTEDRLPFSEVYLSLKTCISAPSLAVLA